MGSGREETQHAIETILTRHLVSRLRVPMFMLDEQANLIFYNELAEEILCCQFNETGVLAFDQWSTRLVYLDEANIAVPYNALPLRIALAERRPAHGTFWIHDPAGVRRQLAITCFPLTGLVDRFLGIVAIFWEIADKHEG